MENDTRSGKDIIADIEKSISTHFIGKSRQIRYMLIGFVSGLHVLIEDVPGVGKTTLARCLAASTGLSFARIQFTPDLLPGDILGMNVWDTDKREFVFRRGAILHQFILADEINRASPRTQSSMLEAMQEESVTVDGVTMDLPKPFFVIATQNPVSFAGTFPLPEAELDRFGISFSLGYASNSEEISILGLDKNQNPLLTVQPVTDPGEVVALKSSVQKVHASDEVKRYVIDIANKIRSSAYVKLGTSTRALQHLIAAARANALCAGRDFVIPEDIAEMAVPVLAHRLILSTEAHMERKTAGDLVSHLVSGIRMPSGVR